MAEMADVLASELYGSMANFLNENHARLLTERPDRARELTLEGERRVCEASLSFLKRLLAPGSLLDRLPTPSRRRVRAEFEEYERDARLRVEPLLRNLARRPPGVTP